MLCDVEIARDLFLKAERCLRGCHYLFDFGGSQIFAPSLLDLMYLGLLLRAQLLQLVFRIALDIVCGARPLEAFSWARALNIVDHDLCSLHKSLRLLLNLCSKSRASFRPLSQLIL